MTVATTLFGFGKPTVGADSDSWGGYLNVIFDSIDKLMGAIATTGSANAYVLTTGQSLAAYADKQSFMLKPNFTNSGAATINVDGLGAKNLYKNVGGTPTAVASGDIASGIPIRVTYDGTQFIVQGVLSGVYQLLDVTLTAVAATTGPTTAPQGRLTLTTATPVLSADVTAATSIYYTPYIGNIVPLYDGTQFLPTTFTELTLALDSNSGHTGYHQTGKNFDLFAFNDSGTLRLGSGPAWTNDTTRADALARSNGAWTNNATITLRFGSASGNTVSVAANYALYVGTFRASADGQTEFTMRPTSAAGGTANKLFLWNAYNRVAVAATNRDSTDSWAYTTATLRAMNNSASNAIAWVAGLAEGSFLARSAQIAANSTGGVAAITGIGADATNTLASGCLTSWAELPSAQHATLNAIYGAPVSIGYHFVCPLEYSSATGTTTWSGDGGVPSVVQAGSILEIAM